MNEATTPAAERTPGLSPGGYVCMWLPTIIYIAMIMIMAAQPAPKLPPVKHVDKYAHTFAYSILAILSYRPFLRHGWKQPLLMTVLLGLAVGMADEGIQALGKTRTADRYDLLADLTGSFVGALAISRFLGPASGRDSLGGEH